MPWRTVVPLAVVSAALGVLFGAAEVATVAFAQEKQAYAGGCSRCGRSGAWWPAS